MGTSSYSDEFKRDTFSRSTCVGREWQIWRHVGVALPHRRKSAFRPELPFDFIATKVHLEPKVPVTALCANVGHQ